MLYWLLDYIQTQFNPPGFGVFGYITVRSALAAVTALIISLIFGRKIIHWLQRMQLGETVRTDIGLDNHLSKSRYAQHGRDYYHPGNRIPDHPVDAA